MSSLTKSDTRRMTLTDQEGSRLQARNQTGWHLDRGLPSLWNCKKHMFVVLQSHPVHSICYSSSNWRGRLDPDGEFCGWKQQWERWGARATVFTSKPGTAMPFTWTVFIPSLQRVGPAFPPFYKWGHWDRLSKGTRPVGGSAGSWPPSVCCIHHLPALHPLLTQHNHPDGKADSVLKWGTQVFKSMITITTSRIKCGSFSNTGSTWKHVFIWSSPVERTWRDIKNTII